MTTIDEQHMWKRRLRLGILIAAAAPTIGLAATCWGMTQAFQTLGSSGVGDPSKLSMPVGEVLIPTAIGLLIGFIGFVVAVVAWMKSKNLRHDQESSPPDHAAP